MMRKTYGEVRGGFVASGHDGAVSGVTAECPTVCPTAPATYQERRSALLSTMTPRGIAHTIAAHLEHAALSLLGRFEWDPADDEPEDDEPASRLSDADLLAGATCSCADVTDRMREAMRVELLARTVRA